MQATNNPGSKAMFIERLLPFPTNHQLIFGKMYLTFLRICITIYLCEIIYVCICTYILKLNSLLDLLNVFLPMNYILLKIGYYFQIQNDYLPYLNKDYPFCMLN